MSRPRRSSAPDVMRRMKCDPLKFLVERFNEEPTEERALALLPYAYPKLKAVELRGPEGSAATLHVVIGGEDDG